MELLQTRVAELEDERAQILAHNVRVASNHTGAAAESASQPHFPSSMGATDQTLLPHISDEQLCQPAAQVNTSAPIAENVQKPTYEARSDSEDDNVS